MTIAELMAHLKEFDPDLPVVVVVVGYEGGYNDISSLDSVRMIPESDVDWFFGAHEEATDRDEKAMTALLLTGKNPVAKDV